MSWMGDSGSFESRAKRRFGAQQLAGSKIEAADSQGDLLLRPLNRFSSKAQALFEGLDHGASKSLDSRAGQSWVVACDTEAAEAAAEAAAKAVEEEMRDLNGIDVNSVRSLEDLDEDDDEEDARPPSYTAVLDDNAYDRKIGLCNGKAKGKGKILGWSEDQVQVIVDDDENDDSDDGEGGQNSRDDIGRASDSSTTSSISAATAEKKVSKIIPKGILKSAAAAQAAKSPRPTQEVSSSGGSSSRPAPGKPCFEYSQTGKCRRGGGCRFAHTLPECIANPEKYTRYEISWDDEEDKGANKAAALVSKLKVDTSLSNYATLALVRDRPGMSETERLSDEHASQKAAAEREERLRRKREKIQAEKERDEDTDNISGAMGGGGARGEARGGDASGNAGNPKKKKAKMGSSALLSFAEDE